MLSLANVRILFILCWCCCYVLFCFVIYVVLPCGLWCGCVYYYVVVLIHIVVFVFAGVVAYVVDTLV